MEGGREGGREVRNGGKMREGMARDEKKGRLVSD